MSTLDALAQLPARLAGDEIHVAFIITIDFDAQPRLWIADRNGKPHPITAFRAHSDDDQRESQPAAWSINDLELAAQYLDGLRGQIRFARQDFKAAHKACLEGIARSRDFQMRNELDRAAKDAEYERDHPHLCSCKRRFATHRGLAMHVARARYGTHSSLAAA